MKEEKIRKSTYLLLSAYFGLIVIFISTMLFMPRWIERFELNHIDTVQQEIYEIIETTPRVDMKQKLSELRKTNAFEIALYNKGDEVYRTVPGKEFKGLLGTFDSKGIVYENQGYVGKSGEYQIWYAIYNPTINDFLGNISLFQLLIVGIAFLLLLIIITTTNKGLTQSLKQIKQTIKQLDTFDLKNIERSSTDVVNEEMIHFVDNLDGRIRSVSRNHTNLEVSLQSERERLTNMMIITRGIVHDLKTPIHQRMLIAGNELSKEPLPQEEDYLNEELLQLDALMNQVNEILDFVGEDVTSLSKVTDRFDLVNLFKEIRNGFTIYLEENELWLNAEMPLTLDVNFNKVVSRLIIHNMLSNALKYANKQSEVIFSMYAEKGELIFECTNEATAKNLERIQQSEQLFNVVEDENATEAEYIYSTGNGLYLIKNLALMNNGAYSTHIDGNKITILVKINDIEVYDE